MTEGGAHKRRFRPNLSGGTPRKPLILPYGGGVVDGLLLVVPGDFQTGLFWNKGKTGILLDERDSGGRDGG